MPRDAPILLYNFDTQYLFQPNFKCMSKIMSLRLKLIVNLENPSKKALDRRLMKAME